mmetsp:Transcript_52482/g.162546  ORF Transcript_52482/g.162546 Transcript_52482/m.162546 type:complete len:654 (-) Transcript_52482:171-2132(-)
MVPLGASVFGLVTALMGCAEAGNLQPNPPNWPDSVQVFGPGQDDEVADAVGKAFAVNGGHSPVNHGQFSNERFAFLFKPGTYHVDVPVGYYTQVLGLGQSPEDVTFDSHMGVYSEESNQDDKHGALSTFWRSAENFRNGGDMLWAVSQAAPLRRIVLGGDLSLAQYIHGIGSGYASGGFLGNSQIAGKVSSASQQQWFTRNAAVGSWAEAVWNMVFVGTQGAPASHCGKTHHGKAIVNVHSTPVIAEKPFISIDGSGKFQLNIPEVQRNRVGPDFSPGRTVGFEQVYVARDTDTAAAINAQLKAGLHVVLSPGIYHLEEPLELSTEGQVLLGLGFATLEPTKGTAAVRVGNVDGVRVAGVLLQAGTGETESLLEWGDGSYPGSDDNPGFLYDVFARVGGNNDPAQGQVRARVMVTIGSGHVVGDNLWLWRADHGIAGKVYHGQNPCETGLLVKGSHVTMYGLAVEHTLQDLVSWAGDEGETYFYQSELPYDVTQAYGDNGYVGYRVLDTVKSHKGYGIGVYHFFRDFPVTVQQGIVAPPALEASFVCPLSVYLTGQGRMEHVINDKGEPTAEDASHCTWYSGHGMPQAARPKAAEGGSAGLEPSAAWTAVLSNLAFWDSIRVMPCMRKGGLLGCLRTVAASGQVSNASSIMVI